MPSSIDDPKAGSTSVRMGPAFLRPAKERRHYELMRSVLTVRNEGDRIVKESHPDPVGPLAMYRTKGRGDKMPSQQAALEAVQRDEPPLVLKTADSHGRPIDLIRVWWPGER